MLVHPPTLVPPTLLPRCTGRDRRRPPPHDRVTDHKMRPTCFALLALLAVFAAAQSPCALVCRRQTCSSLNHSFSCEELSGFGCDCVSRRWGLKPRAHSRSRASHTYRRPRTHRRAAAPTRWLPSRRRHHQRPPSRHPPPSRWLRSPPAPPTSAPSAPMAHSEVAIAQDQWASEVEGLTFFRPQRPPCPPRGRSTRRLRRSHSAYSRMFTVDRSATARQTTAGTATTAPPAMAHVITAARRRRSRSRRHRSRRLSRLSGLRCRRHPRLHQCHLGRRRPRRRHRPRRRCRRRRPWCTRR